MSKIDPFSIVRRGELLHEIADLTAGGKAAIPPQRQWWKEQLGYLVDSCGLDRSTPKDAAQSTVSTLSRIVEIGRCLFDLQDGRMVGNPETLERLRKRWEERLQELAREFEASAFYMMNYEPPLRRRHRRQHEEARHDASH